MRQVPIEHRSGTPLTPEVHAAVSAQPTLGEVTQWARTLTPPRLIDEIITQDEYTHDVILGLDAECWLVYDTT